MAISGMVYLLLPGVEAPDLAYSALMVIAGLAWGTYSLLGAGGIDPTISTANNFIYAIPLAILVSILDSEGQMLTWQGGLLAAASGTLASGLGYAIWYTALKYLKTTSAATVQLSVPALATFGGVVFLSEPLSLRIVFATALTLGGIAIVLNRSPQA